MYCPYFVCLVGRCSHEWAVRVEAEVEARSRPGRWYYRNDSCWASSFERYSKGPRETNGKLSSMKCSI